MCAEKKRIGLVLASIHTGSAQNVWPSFVRTAIVEDKSLFIFPGGRLNAWTDSEYLRNSVYSLVNSENLDGCISWSSAIRHTEPEEQFDRFHSGFNIPYVTLAYKIPGHPCVEFDSYAGMKLLTAHCICAHGARKIAFIRGPDFHQSAFARMEGFKDALKEAGIPVSPDSRLITDPFNWNSGDAAAAQLFENRKLKPGRDFDTLVCSSDLMALKAINYFAEQGYHIPGDYHAVGFNNSVESRLAESPLSTVHIPYSALSIESFRILMKLQGKKGSHAKADSEGIVLPTEIILRESCGCAGLHFLRQEDEGLVPGEKKGSAKAGEKPTGIQSAEETLTAMIADFFKLSPADSGAFVEPVINSLFDICPQNNPESFSSAAEESFFRIFEKVLVRFFGAGLDTESLFTILGKIFDSGLVPASLVSRLKPTLYQTILKVREHLVLHSRYEKENWNTALNSLKCELLGTRDRNSLVQSLARHLPKIGINHAGIALYRDDKTTLWVGSFSHEGLSPVREQSFPAMYLVPKPLNSEFSKGIFMVQPLFIENQSLGYFVHNVPFYDGVIFEELRSAVSYALKGIFQLEELVRAKRIAEQAELAKTEFIRTLENELYDPLGGVMERIEELEKLKFSGLALGEELERLKSFVASREKRTENLIDLALSGIDELVLKKTLFDPEDLFPEIASVKIRSAFPLLLGDKLKLSQCFSFIREEYSGDFSAAITYGGLEISFMAGKTAGFAAGKAADKAADKAAGTALTNEKGEEQALLLSESIILKHGGEFTRNKSACVVILPWPDLTGEEAMIRIRARQEHILALSDLPIPGDLSQLPVIRDPEKAAGSPERTAFIAWNTDSAEPEELLKVYSLLCKSKFKETVFLCYGKKLIEEESVIGGLERLLRSPRKIFLFIGEERDNWESFRELEGDKIYISSMPLFNETVAAIMPQMIILNSLTPEAAAVIRRHPITATVPIIMTGARIDSAADVMALSQYFRLIICHRSAISFPEFHSRLQAILSGAEILPPHTGALVKKTILYLDQHIQSPISRWKLAETVNVNEDYLSRIFHREMGLSLWDYLNRLRVYMAVDLLLQTNESIQEIAFHSGFQDQAYFCRVFKKIYGLAPGQLRKQKKKSE